LIPLCTAEGNSCIRHGSWGEAMNCIRGTRYSVDQLTGVTGGTYWTDTANCIKSM